MSEIIDRAAKAMQESKAWPSVFKAGTAQELARIAFESARVPTNEMIRAGLRVKPTVLETWQAMHAEMLK